MYNRLTVVRRPSWFPRENVLNADRKEDSVVPMANVLNDDDLSLTIESKEPQWQTEFWRYRLKWRIGVLLQAACAGTCAWLSVMLWEPLVGTSIFLAILLTVGLGFVIYKQVIGPAWKAFLDAAKDDADKFNRQWRVWFQSLFRWNFVCALAHLIVGVWVGVTLHDGDWDVKGSIQHFSWTPINATANATCGDDNVTCAVKVKTSQTGSIQINLVLLIMHLLSVITHGVACWSMASVQPPDCSLLLNIFGTIAFLPNLQVDCMYMRLLRRKKNPWRWYEYFFSASLMQVIVMILTGYTNVWILSMSALCIALTQAFGYASEEQVSTQFVYNIDFDSIFPQESFWRPLFIESGVLFALGFVFDGTLRDVMWFVSLGELLVAALLYRTNVQWRPRKWQYYLMGWVAFCMPWIAVYYAFYDSISRSPSEPPEWVKAIIWSLVLLFACFAVVMWWYLRHAKERFVAFYSEGAYLVMSLVAKAALAVQFWYGLTQRVDRGLKAPNATVDVEEVCKSYLNLTAF